MGLNMIVGALVDTDDEYRDELRADFAVVGEVLERAGAGAWAEPDLSEGREGEFEAWGYSGLHTVRRLGVHLAASGRLPEPLGRGVRATDDPLLREAYEGMPGDPPGPFDHLVQHSDCEGFYVPVDFARVIVDDAVLGGHLGSSVRLGTEVRRIAGALGLPPDLDPHSEEVFEGSGTEVWRRYRVESFVCLQLLGAVELSVATGAAIVFC